MKSGENKEEINLFQIDLKSRKAVYNQIVDNFERLVDSGVLARGVDVPNVKELAKTLTVNPNIVQKAYFELEHKGVFYTEDGEQWIVAPDDGEQGEERLSRQDEVSALYGRIHSDIQELVARGELREDIGKLIGMGGEKSYISLENLTKSFDKNRALSDLTLNVKKGSIYGLVGINGSGKTTALKLIAGLLRPDSGLARINGMPAYDNNHDKVVGYMPEDIYFLQDYNLKRLKDFVSNKYKSSWNEERYSKLIERFGLSEEQTLSTFSRGLQKQAGFILAISTMPDILLLDETIDGLDPIVRKKAFRFIIEDVAAREMTVIVTSHNMRELDGICDTIGIIKDGHMVVERDLDDLRSNVHKLHVAFTPDFLNNNFPYDELDVLHMEELGSTDILVVRGKEEEVEAHIRKFNPLVYDHLPMTLEEIFIYETEGDRDDD